MAKWDKEKRDAWYDENRDRINARRRELRASRKDVERSRRKAYRDEHRAEINAWQRDRQRRLRGLVVRECVCEICGKAFETARKVQHTCGAAECQEELQRRKMRERYHKIGRGDGKVREKLRTNGITEAEAIAVIAAQDSGDRERLWKESQTWTPAQRKFAKRRYMTEYGMTASTMCGAYNFGGRI